MNRVQQRIGLDGRCLTGVVFEINLRVMFLKIWKTFVFQVTLL